MRGLKDIADACVLSAKAQGVPHRFVQPDNSFGTWWNIIERSAKVDPPTELRREVHVLESKQQNKLHVTPEDVKEFYKKHPPVPSELWYVVVGCCLLVVVCWLLFVGCWLLLMNLYLRYITPVGNPSGTKIGAKQLVETCETILQHNSRAHILLDSVVLHLTYF